MSESIFSYLKNDNRGPIKNIDEVDSFVFTMLSYCKFEYYIRRHIDKVKIKDFAKDYREHIFNTLDTNKDRLVFLELLEEDIRYQDLEIVYMEEYFDEKIEVQYASIGIMINKSIFVSYRGTDTTLLGWKEDFNLSYLDEIPGQVMAKETLSYLMHEYKKYDFFVGGHSKGGLLAVSSVINQPISNQERIKYVMDLDSPGLKDDVLNSDGYLRMIDKIHTFVPEHSVVGLIYRKKQQVTVVETTNNGIMEHYGFAWMVEDNHFAVIKVLESGEELDDSVFNTVLKQMSKEELEQFSMIVYSLLQDESGLLKINELMSPRKIKEILRVYKDLDDSQKEQLKKTGLSIAGMLLKEKIFKK